MVPDGIDVLARGLRTQTLSKLGSVIIADSELLMKELADFSSFIIRDTVHLARITTLARWRARQNDPVPTGISKSLLETRVVKNIQVLVGTCRRTYVHADLDRR
jgi:hypothetical protein